MSLDPAEPAAVHPTAVTASLPPWLIASLAELPSALDDEAAMRLVNDLADRNWRAGNGGPFAAAVVEADGALVAVGVNVVLQEQLSGMHAEVMAIGLAQRRLGGFDLSVGADGRRRECSLVVNWRPCAMCFGALLWSGATRLVIAGDGPECESLTGFDEGPVVEDWRGQLALRGIEVVEGVRREEAVGVFRAYGGASVHVYNARRG